MEWMKEWRNEIREQTITARSARNRRGVKGKRGAVSLPSDFLTEKQREALNGECKSYKLGSPMQWEQFKEMPTDLQAMYIKLIRNSTTLRTAFWRIVWAFRPQLSARRLRY